MTEEKKSLLYRGFFSTRKQNKSHNFFNNVYDKLHHIKYEGLTEVPGTLDRPTMHALVVGPRGYGMDDYETNADKARQLQQDWGSESRIVDGGVVKARDGNYLGTSVENITQEGKGQLREGFTCSGELQGYRGGAKGELDKLTLGQSEVIDSEDIWSYLGAVLDKTFEEVKLVDVTRLVTYGDIVETEEAVKVDGTGVILATIYEAGRQTLLGELRYVVGSALEVKIATDILNNFIAGTSQDEALLLEIELLNKVNKDAIILSTLLGTIDRVFDSVLGPYEGMDDVYTGVGSRLLANGGIIDTLAPMLASEGIKKATLQNYLNQLVFEKKVEGVDAGRHVLYTKTGNAQELAEDLYVKVIKDVEQELALLLKKSEKSVEAGELNTFYKVAQHSEEVILPLLADLEAQEGIESKNYMEMYKKLTGYIETINQYEDIQGKLVKAPTKLDEDIQGKVNKSSDVRLDEGIHGKVSKSSDVRLDEGIHGKVSKSSDVRLDEGIHGKVSKSSDVRLDGGMHGKVNKSSDGKLDEGIHGKVSKSSDVRLDEGMHGKVSKSSDVRLDEGIHGKVSKSSDGKLDEGIHGKVSKSSEIALQGGLWGGPTRTKRGREDRQVIRGTRLMGKPFTDYVADLWGGLEGCTTDLSPYIQDELFGLLSSLNQPLESSGYRELFAELAGTVQSVAPTFYSELFGEFSDISREITPTFYSEIFGEFSDVDREITPTFYMETFGELTSIQEPLTPTFYEEVFAEFTQAPQDISPMFYDELFGEFTQDFQEVLPYVDASKWGELANNRVAKQVEEKEEVAVYACNPLDLKIKKRPNLEPEKEPDDPLWDWECSEGYVCDDWLIVPLKDFNFENPKDGFFDPTTFTPYYPTGQVDEQGNPYVLAPYSVLDEPISNGVDVGGKEPMFINPCNLYSAINYLVQLYDTHKVQYRASDPLAVMSRVLNLLYDKIQGFVDAWTPDSDYGIDEMWRIYRFIRWLAIGVVNRFYRIKLIYTWGDWEENFNSLDLMFNQDLKISGCVVRNVSIYGQVLEGHPISKTLQNKAYLEFEVPKHIESTSISFDVGHDVPSRPEVISGTFDWLEDFEGVPQSFRVTGEGWEKMYVPGVGNVLAIEEVAQAKTYKTNTFTVPGNIASPININFYWEVRSNMDTLHPIRLMCGNQEIQKSTPPFHRKQESVEISPGEYHFELQVPQSEDTLLSPVSFPVTDIQTKWTKAGTVVPWIVQGDTIYEIPNTSSVALVYNQDWLNDSVYEFRGEFMTKYDPIEAGMEDWIGYVFNVKDANNYYALGMWVDVSFNGTPDGGWCGVWKVVDGVGKPTEGMPPTWKMGDGNKKWNFDIWYAVEIKVEGNKFDLTIDGLNQQITDDTGWGIGACGLAAYSNPHSTFRSVTYSARPSLSAYIDNIKITSPGTLIKPPSPTYAIDFLMNQQDALLSDFSTEGKRGFSYPILAGKHKAEWVYKKLDDAASIQDDASFIDNILIKGIAITGAEVEEEILGCGGHMALKLLIENLLTYYRKHHQGCHGRRDIWIVE